VDQGFQLIFQDTKGLAARQFDQARVVLGRSIVCDVVLDSPHLSRKHAEIVRDTEGWIIRDLHSRHGIAVNGRPITVQRLVHGDRIALAPNAESPTLLEFRSREFSDSVPPQVILSDETGPTSIVASIDLRELSNNLSQSGGQKQSPLELYSSEVSSILAAPGGADATSGERTSQLPVLSMFKSVGEILLAYDSLDELLQQVVNLIAVHLPRRRSVACMVDQASGEIQPRCFSQEGIGDQEIRKTELGASTELKDGIAKHEKRQSPGSHACIQRVCMTASPADRRPFLISRSILHEAVRVQRAMLVASVADDPRFHAAASIQQMGIQSAICVPLYYQGQVKGVIYVDSQRYAAPLNSRDLEVLTVLGLMVASGIVQVSLRSDVARERTMRQRLARYNSPRVVEQIMKLTPRQEGEMLADEYDISVLFADITGFSALAETWSAAEVVRVLNLVFERWTNNVFQHDGTLDKYIGDAVMAVFGAPLRQADHARRAIATALTMQETLYELNRSRPGEPPLQLRIGINTGHVIAGDIGSPLHKSYTVIGDVVNIASRLETTVALPGQILIGEETYEQAREDYVCESLGEIRLRGKQHAIRAYRVIGRRET
jgi:class 3 adenylate cyclase